MRRAYVYFWDGFVFGPRIDTHDERLRERIERIAMDDKSPGIATGMFLALDMSEEIPSQVWNAPPARTVGQYVQAAESEGNWPTVSWGGEVKSFPQAGVFIVNMMDKSLRITGGLGFSKNEDECNPRILREEMLFSQEGKSYEG